MESLKVEWGGNTVLVSNPKTQKAIKELIFGSIEAPTMNDDGELKKHKSKKKMLLGARRWSPGEESKLKEILSPYPPGKGGKNHKRAKVIKQLAQEIGRTPMAISIRANKVMEIA